MGRLQGRRRWFLAISLLAAAWPIYAASERAAADGRCDVADLSLDAEEARFVDLLNAYRAEHGLSTLTVSVNLTRAATWMAADMGAKDYFAHQDSLGRDAHTRIAECGYAGPAGENLAAGKSWSTAQKAIEAWKASSGHNTNMLLDRYVQIGVARVQAPGSRYGWYWATAFGTRSDGTLLIPAAAPAADATVAPSPSAAVPAPPAAAPAETTETRAAALSLHLAAGANLVAWPGPSRSPEALLNGDAQVRVVYAWDAKRGQWLRYGRGLPEYARNLRSIEPGSAYWVIAVSAGDVPAKR